MNPWDLKPDPQAAPPCPPPVLSPDMGALLGALLRDVSTLARATALDRESDPRRVLPAIGPAVLWRMWPRVLERAADLAAALPWPPIGAADVNFLRLLADAIETGRPAPQIAGVPSRPVMSEVCSCGK